MDWRDEDRFGELEQDVRRAATIIRDLLATNDGLIYTHGVSDAVERAEAWLAENGE